MIMAWKKNSDPKIDTFEIHDIDFIFSTLCIASKSLFSIIPYL